MNLPRIAAVAFLCLPAGAVLALPPLGELESRLAVSPESRMYDRAYDAARDQLRAGRINLGVSLYADAGVAANRDIIDPTHSYGYRQTSEGVGISVPILGSRMQMQSGLDDQQVQLARLDAQRELGHRALLGRLRKAYARYWQAQRARILAEGVLADETGVRSALDLRTAAGMLLDSDRLDLESGFTQARRDAALAAAAQANALDELRTLTDSELDGGVAAPPMHAGCAPADAAATTWIAGDPELQSLQRVVELRSTDPRASALYPVQSNLQVGYQNRDQLTTGQHGGSGTVTWTIQMPIGYRAQRRLYTQAAASELARARLEYEVRREELKDSRRELIQRESALQESLRLASSRLAAADAAVREGQLRAAALGGDVVERLQHARLARYEAAKAVTDAETALAFWYADWSRFDESPCASTVAAPDASAQDGPVPRTLYIWRAASWLASADAPSGDADLGRLRAAGFGRLLISLDARQLSAAIADTAALRAAVRATQRTGLKVGLLLGDPSWILDAHRSELLRILRRLADVPFDALHLDLEPEQIERDATANPRLFAQFVATLRAAAAASPWPVELSTHPRNLDVVVNGVGFADLLHELRIAPTLMIYVANPQRALAVAEPILKAYPQLHFRVALSLERAGPDDHSLAPYSEVERQRRLAIVEQGLRARNFDGLALQLEDGWSLARPRQGG